MSHRLFIRHFVFITFVGCAFGTIKTQESEATTQVKTPPQKTFRSVRQKIGAQWKNWQDKFGEIKKFITQINELGTPPADDAPEAEKTAYEEKVKPILEFASTLASNTVTTINQARAIFAAKEVQIEKALNALKKRVLQIQALQKIQQK